MAEREPALVLSRDTAGLTRREFLLAAGGVLVLFGLPGELRAGAPPSGTPQPTLADDLNAWLRIGQEGRVTVLAPTPETGQGLRTLLAQLAAEELSVPLAWVEVVLGDTDRVPADPGLCPDEAFGLVASRVRQAAAEAREVLLQIAGERWSVPPDQVVLREGRAALASDPSRTIAIGQLAAGQRLVRPSKQPVAPRPAADLTTVGRPTPRIEGPAYVRGRAQFAADLRLPGLAYGKILRPPCVGAQLVSADTRAAAGQPGVIAVVRDEDMIAVIANRLDTAERALLSVQATWREADQASVGSLFDDLRRTAKQEGTATVQGEPAAALASARHGYSASYRLSFTAHAPLEPHAAVADLKEGRLTIHASTERPFWHQQAVARALGLPAERVRVIATAVGGAFGGKDAPDLSVQAARLAQTLRRPIMLAQSREEEMSSNYFRPAALVDLRAGVTAEGLISAWDCDVYNCGPEGSLPPYGIQHQRVRVYRCGSPLPQGPARGLGATANTFAREVHLDHIAAELRADPIELRLRHLKENPRMARVVRAAAERFGWVHRLPPTGLGAGFACADAAGSCAAVMAEVEVDLPSGPPAGRGATQIQVRRVWAAQDSGLIVNPDNARNQIEGAVVMGLGLALKEAVRYEQGRILSRSFASYPIPTFGDAPEVDTILVSDPDEPPHCDGLAVFCAMAPALANAVFDATGKRLRDLPLARAAP